MLSAYTEIVHVINHDDFEAGFNESDLSDESFESVQEEGESSHTGLEVQNVSILFGFCIKLMNIGATICIVI